MSFPSAMKSDVFLSRLSRLTDGGDFAISGSVFANSAVPILASSSQRLLHSQPSDVNQGPESSLLPENILSYQNGDTCFKIGC